MVSGSRAAVRSTSKHLLAVILENKLRASFLLGFIISVVPTAAIVVFEEVVESPATFSLDWLMIEVLLAWISTVAGFLTALFFGLISWVTTAKCLIQGGNMGDRVPPHGIRIDRRSRTLSHL